MTIVLAHNNDLELNLVEYSGAVTLDELKAIAAYGARHPEFLKSDTLAIVRPDGDFRVGFAELDALFARYAKLYGRLDFQIYRRSAWLCRSPAAQSHIDYWVGGRDLKETLSSAVRQFASLAEACDWLLLSAADIAAVERSEGFIEIARFETGPARAAAR